MSAAYQKVSWRGTLPVDPATREMAVSFDLESGETIRIKLDVNSAEDLAGSITDYLYDYERKCSQNDRSSGMPSSLGSKPDEGQ